MTEEYMLIASQNATLKTFDTIYILLFIYIYVLFYVNRVSVLIHEYCKR